MPSYILYTIVHAYLATAGAGLGTRGGGGGPVPAGVGGGCKVGQAWCPAGMGSHCRPLAQKTRCALQPARPFSASSRHNDAQPKLIPCCLGRQGCSRLRCTGALCLLGSLGANRVFMGHRAAGPHRDFTYSGHSSGPKDWGAASCFRARSAKSLPPRCVCAC